MQKIGAYCATYDVGPVRVVTANGADNFVLNPFAFQNASDCRFLQKVIDSLFISIMTRKHTALIFQRMAKWNVSDVVQKRSDSNQRFIFASDRMSAANSLKYPARHP